MMRWNSFGRTLFFGAATAALAPAVWLVAAPLLGGSNAMALTCIAAASLYIAGLGSSLRRGLSLALPAAAVVFGVWLGAPLLGVSGIAAAGLASVVAIAVCRTCLYATRPGRAVAVELVLGLAGLALANWLAWPGPVGFAAAIWGYFLLQSCFFLVGPPAERGPEPTRDPFEQARARMLSLLEDAGA